MDQRTVSVLARIDVPAERLWEAVVDHEGMGRWLGIPVKVIAGPGDGGLGTVRRLGRAPLSFDEEVVGFLPPRELVYRVIRGVPGLRYHLGEVRVQPTSPTSSELRWEITLATAARPLTDALAQVMQRRIDRGIIRLRDHLGGG